MNTTTNGHVPARPDERALREDLRTQFAEAVSAGKPKTARRLLESFWLWDSFGGSDLWDRIRPRTNDGEAGSWLPPSVPTDKRHGAYWPIWRTQVELDERRQQSRVRVATNSYAQGVLRQLTNAVIGKGFDYTAQWLGDDGKPEALEQVGEQEQAYVRKVQEYIDEFCRKNHWNASIDPSDMSALAATREREIFRAVQVDGECFVRFHGQDGGGMVVRLIDASQVREGTEYLPQYGWTYGIQHEMEPFEDVETPRKYAVFWMDAAAKGGEGGGAGDRGTWEEIDAAEVIHLKGPDTPSNVKRGMPLFIFGLGEALDRAEALQRALSYSARVRASIAETWQYEQATQTQISSMAQALAERQTTNPVTGGQTNVERIVPGTVRRGPTGATLVPPSADNSEAYLAGKNGDLQEAAAGAGIASFVLGGLESGNYSNFESASYPPVVNAQCEQEYYKLAFSRVIWKALEWAAQQGAVPADVAEHIYLHVEAPAVLHRNELEKAQEDQILVTGIGCKDRQTCATERGFDWQQVEANNEEYTKKQQELMPQPMPGQQPGEGRPPGGGPKPPGGGAGPQPPKPPMPKPKGPPHSVSEGFDPGERRDESGKWTGGGGGGTDKAPHEMTLHDYVHSRSKAIGARIAQTADDPTKARERERLASEATALNMALKNPNGITSNIHKMAVARALADRKPVPLEVVKDYPDLHSKYKSRYKGKTRLSKTLNNEPPGGFSEADVVHESLEGIDAEHGPGAALRVARAAVRLLEAKK